MRSVTHTTHERGTMVLTLLVTISLVSSALAQMGTLSPKETFASAHLTAAEIAEIITAVEESAYDTPDSWEEELRVRRVNLGNTPGIVVMGSKLLCGGTGNCQIWVLRKIDGKWKSLFATEQAPVAEGFQLGPNSTHGIKDLTIVANTSATTTSRVSYKFDGKNYQPTRPKQ